MTNEIQTSGRRDITLEVLDLAMKGGAIMHGSRLFGAANAEQAAAIMLKGYEIGLPMTAAFEFINIIQGKPSLIPRGALALIYQSGQLADLKIDEQPNACTVTMQRTNGVSYTCTYTLDDAKKAGLVSKGGAWEMYQANMLRWRAIGFCADIVFPDVLAGMKTADQFGAVPSDEGGIIDGEVIANE
jgi:hypothetical protein